MSEHLVPDGLGVRGAVFFTAMRDRVGDVNPVDHELLTEAAHCVDELERLRLAWAAAEPTALGSRRQVVAHPLAAELRFMRATLVVLLDRLRPNAVYDDEADRELVRILSTPTPSTYNPDERY